MQCINYRCKFLTRFAIIMITAVLLQPLITSRLYAQANTPAVDQVLTTTQNFYKTFPAEKLYLKTDRPYYTVSDTIWYKVWLFNAASYTPSKQSGKLYVELINDSSTVISRFAVPVKMGLGQGQLALSKNLAEGNYTLRAYTNWMQNFGSKSFFSRRLYVGKPVTAGNWLINEQHNIKEKLLNFDVTLSKLDKLPLSYKDVELKFTDGNSIIYKGSYVTGDNGKIHGSFELPSEISGKAYLIISDKTSKSSFKIPFYLDGGQNIDLQFMPESGKLVAGLVSRVGFKAIGENGLGVAIQGNINDSKGTQVSTFKSLRNGMGSFVLLPKAGERYTANYMINGIYKTVALPPVSAEGVVLRIDNLANPDTLLIHMTATPVFTGKDKRYILLAQSAGGVYLGAAFDMQNGFNNMVFPKNTFVTGIVNFTVLDGNQPIAQRKIFIDHHDRLALQIDTSQNSDSTGFNVHILDAAGKPVQGSFAVSVTDNDMVKQDTLQENLVTRMLLTSELQGNIEEPAWYFKKPDVLTAAALDNLMLTQGWTGFDDAVFSQPLQAPKFFAEPDNSVTGRISGLFNKPFKNAKVSLFTVNKKFGTVLIDTVSDETGRFYLRDLPLLDTVIYHIKATGKNGKEIGAMFALDEFKPAPVDRSEKPFPMPWYAQTGDAAMIRFFQNPPQALADVNPSDVKGKLLKQVVIKGKKPVDAKTYIPMIRKVIDEKTLVEAGNKNLRDLLAEKFNSLWLGGFYSGSPFEKVEQHDASLYLVGHHVLADVIVDGESMRETYWASFTQKLQSFLYTVPASEIKSVRIYDGFYPLITIQTRGGTGLNTLPTPGLVVYRPVPYNLPAKFYTPRFKVNMPSSDSPRPTIYWEPNLLTDGHGNAVIPFAMQRPGNYTISIEGTDMLGNFGYQTQAIQVTAK